MNKEALQKFAGVAALIALFSYPVIPQVSCNGLTALAASNWDLSLAAVFKLPTSSGAAPASDGLLAFDSAAHLLKVGVNGATAALAPVVAYANQTGVGSSLVSSTLPNGPFPSGLYLVTAYLATSVAGSGSVVTTIGFTDAVGVKIVSMPATLVLTSGAWVSGTALIQVAPGSSITYGTTWTGTGQYNIYVALERVQ